MITLQERVHATRPPQSWAVGKLHRVLHVRKNFKNTDMQEDNLLSLSYGRVIRKSIDTAEGLLPESFETYQIVEAGNIVMRLTDLQNDKRSLRQGLVHERGIITSAYDVLEVGSEHDPRFWTYALLALDLSKYYYSLGGGVRQSISFSDFPNDWIAVPDSNTQKVVAEFLDRATALIDQLIEKKERMARLLTEKRRIAVLACLSEGLGSFSWLPQSQSVVFQFKKSGWACSRVKSLVSFMTSGSRGWSSFLSTEGEAFIQSGNIGRYMEVDLRSAQRVQPQVGAEAERTLVKKDDILICITGGRTGAVGYVGSIDERAYINQHVCLLRARRQSIIPELLAHILWSEVGQKQIGLCQYGVKQGIGFNEVANLQIPVPPRELQQKLIVQIGAQTARLDKLTKAIHQSVARLHEVRSALITAAVTGQIDMLNWKKRGTIYRHLDAVEAKATT
jgi:type I restriction enzyme, S subunit